MITTLVVETLGRRGPRTYPLAKFLKPERDGSDQGQIEDLERTTEMLQERFGELLAFLVEGNVLSFEKALELAGLHKWKLEYVYGEVKLVPIPAPPIGNFE